MALSTPKHVILVEIDWDSGTQGYAYERYRTPSLDYQDLLVSVSNVTRSCSPFGTMNFPTASLEFSNANLEFSALWRSTPHRNKTVRIKVVPPSSGLSAAITVFSGTISKARIRNKIFSIEVSSINFEELFSSDMSHVLPVLNKGNFPNLADGQIPTNIPLLYGRLSSTSGEPLSAPTVTPATVPAYLIDNAGITNFNWSGHNASASSAWTGVAYSPTLDIYVAVGGTGATRAMSSTDGVNWTNRTIAGEQWNSVIWVTQLGLFIAISNNTSAGSGVATSANGTTWTLRTAASSRDWRGICWSTELSKLVVVAASGDIDRVQTSGDGITWTPQSAASSESWNSVVWAAGLGTDGLFVAVSAVSTVFASVMTSPDAQTWTARTTPNSPNNWAGIEWAAELGILVAVGYAGVGDRIMISEDGITWILVASPADRDWLRVVWAPEIHLFAAVGFTGTSADVMTSSDGVTWDVRVTPGTAAWRGLTWAAEANWFIAVGSTATDGVMTSPANLDQLYKYAIGAGNVSGDLGNLGKSQFVFVYETGIYGSKTILYETYNGFDVSVIGFAYDPRDIKRPDEREVTFYGSGIRQGSGEPYLNPAEIKEHFLTTYAGVVSGQIDATAQAAAESAANIIHTADDDYADVAPASCGILIQDLHESLRSIIEKIDGSFGMTTALLLGGKLATFVLTLGTEPATIASLNDTEDILQNTLEISDPEVVATVLQLNFAERGTHGGSGDPVETAHALAAGSLTYEIQRASTDMFGAGSLKLVEQDLNLLYCRRIVAALNIARAVSEFLRPKAEIVSFEVPISYFDDIDVFDYIDVTHWQGTEDADGYTATKMQVTEITVILEPASPRLRIVAFRRAPGMAVHDNFDRAASNTLGLSWSESESAADSLSTANVPSASFNQSQCLRFKNNAYGIAFWNVTTDNDQLASIQIAEFGAGTGTQIGVCVRGSGTYNSFTGYIATFERPATDEVYARLYKATAQNLSSALGTLLGEKQLVYPTIGGWLAQGDVIELRVAGTKIEVFYFSDIPANNFGKVIDVTDATHSSGQIGIVSADGGGSYLTNFYGRSLT